MTFLPRDMSRFKWRRSALFLPASNPRAIEKAKSLSADCLIFDLEDSVSPQSREAAFANLREHVAGHGFGKAERIVRTPSLDSEAFDAAFIAAIAIAPDALLLPKIENPKDIEAMARRLAASGCDATIWIMVETPAALMNLREITAIGSDRSSRLSCLVVGPNDLAKSTGAAMQKGRAVMVPWLMQILAAGRANGLCVLDGVYNAFRDHEGLAEECAQGAAMGFDGKTLIHPAQIEAANVAFSPSAGDIARAREIVAAFDLTENAGRGAIQIDGEMVERLHLEEAAKLLAALQLLEEPA